MEIKKLPPFTPQMNARMENFIRAIKTECLDKIIFASERQLRLAVKEYLEYWNHYRPHEGLGGIMVDKEKRLQQAIIGIKNRMGKNAILQLLQKMIIFSLHFCIRRFCKLLFK